MAFPHAGENRDSLNFPKVQARKWQRQDSGWVHWSPFLRTPGCSWMVDKEPGTAYGVEARSSGAPQLGIAINGIMPLGTVGHACSAQGSMH